MTNKLPEDFIKRMNDYLKEDALPFFESFNDKSQKAFHVNIKRNINQNIYSCYSKEQLSPIAYYSNGFYDNSEIKIGNSILSHAGIVYSQDPAAMMPVACLKDYIKANDKILDLCSAPGGKASQMAMLLSDTEGFLLANEINPSRNKILCSNIERMGYKNVLVTRLYPDELAKEYPSYFDIVLVDAPCSGEGMFRKYPESINEWSLDNVKLCAQRQKEILSSAFDCLNNQGYLLYSTCTYSKEEDEEIVQWILDNFPVKLVKPKDEILKYTVSSEYIEARKFYPHICNGEGQFFCIFQKLGNKIFSNLTDLKKLTKLSKSEIKIIKDQTDNCFDIEKFNLFKYQNKILTLSNPNIKLPSKGISQAFVQLGNLENNKFKLEHHFCHAYGMEFNNIVNLDVSDDNLLKYLHGEELTIESVPKGYGIIAVNKTAIGAFKASNGRLKNHYPKGLRNLNYLYYL